MVQETGDSRNIQKIQEIKSRLGKSLLILAHHYQRKEIVELGDYSGDSFELSRKAAGDSDARFIVFCGVHFMAESAEILSQAHQTVQIPDAEAGCWMADMADIYLVRQVWETIAETIRDVSICPIVYMNSDAHLKAFCGSRGGTVCTSSNAETAFRWGRKRFDKIFFFPDQHLGRNTGNRLGVPPEEMIVWNPHKPFGGNSPEQIRAAKIILWDGHCLVHTRFNCDQMVKMRDRFPEAKIIVHPECTQEVVAAADAVGSTGAIVNYVDGAPAGSTIIIGTETHLIQRLALEYPDKKILELHHSLCPNMYKINLENLCRTLEGVGEVNRVTVSENVKEDARKALDRMLALAP
jgi:quinolinate synthase